MLSNAVSRVFISYSQEDFKFVDTIVEVLRDHYINTWYAPRNMPGGKIKESIHQAILDCDYFLVVISPDAMKSEWVKFEINLAMANSSHIQIIPVLTKPCDWMKLHKDINLYELFNFYDTPIDSRMRLLRYLGVEPHTYPPLEIGDIKMPVYVFVGGDGKTKYKPEDIICKGPGAITDSSNYFLLDKGIKTFADDYIPKREIECEEKGIVFVNNPQVRLDNVSWGGTNNQGGLANTPLRMDFSWTQYYDTAVTNVKTDERLSDGKTIGQKYAAPIDNLSDCKLSNPIATNLSVITSDNYIFYGQRGNKVATLAGGFQPAVSGNGQPEDIDENDTYNPFLTAIREGKEECIGDSYPLSQDEVVFFGLGRWMKTRFPFLFGEIRLENMTAKQLEGMRPTNEWEGFRLKLPFTIEDVTKWVIDRYLDQYHGRQRAAVSSPIFSLLQSLLYEYKDQWGEIVERLIIPEISNRK